MRSFNLFGILSLSFLFDFVLSSDSLCKSEEFSHLLVLSEFLPAQALCSAVYPLQPIKLPIDVKLPRDVVRRGNEWGTWATTASPSTTEYVPHPPSTTPYDESQLSSMWSDVLQKPSPFISTLCSCVQSCTTTTAEVIPVITTTIVPVQTTLTTVTTTTTTTTSTNPTTTTTTDSTTTTTTTTTSTTPTTTTTTDSTTTTTDATTTTTTATTTSALPSDPSCTASGERPAADGGSYTTYCDIYCTVPWYYTNVYQPTFEACLDLCDQDRADNGCAAVNYQWDVGSCQLSVQAAPGSQPFTDSGSYVFDCAYYHNP